MKIKRQPLPEKYYQCDANCCARNARKVGMTGLMMVIKLATERKNTIHWAIKQAPKNTATHGDLRGRPVTHPNFERIFKDGLQKK